MIANRRGFLKMQGTSRIGGIVYTESARKVAYFVDNAERSGFPLLYVQDVSGFMVGVEAEIGQEEHAKRGDDQPAGVSLLVLTCPHDPNPRGRERKRP